MIEKPPPPPAANPQRLQGERRVITMLFSDIVGSTALAAQLDPEEWAEIMNEAFPYLIAPVERYGGTVARLMGDAILAFFGAPTAHEDDPQRAILAGLDIISGISDFRRQIQADYSLDFNVRVGINTGPVVVGEIGTNVTQEYTAMGDAINLASRMETTAVPGTVQISEDTYRLVAPLFDVWDAGKIALKGKEEPIRAYRVLGPADRPGRLRGIQGIETTLIGRSESFEQLQHAVGRLQEGKGTIIFLVGEAGLGKSRLIEELRLYCLSQTPTSDDTSALQWNAHAGSSYEMNQPYGTLRHQIRQEYGIRESDLAAESLARLDRFTATYPADLQATARAIFAAIFGLPPTAVTGQGSWGAGELGSGGGRRVLRDTAGESPNLSVSQSPISSLQSPVSNSGPGFQLGNESFRRELYTFSLEALQRQIESGQLIVRVLDDLQWADPASVELYQYLLQLVPANPILDLMALRPERDTPGWQLKAYALKTYPDYCREINLQPLSSAEGTLLVDQLLRISDLPPELRETILEKAEGNPFFLEELVRTLMDKGLIIRTTQGDRWRLAEGVDPGDLNPALPGNVHSLLAARIDRLDAETRATLQLAAVIGRLFEGRVLEQLTRYPGRLASHLQTLQAQDLVLPVRGQDGTYRFRHELTRDAAYASILHRQRRRFHRQVGEALERLYVDRPAEQAPALALHFEQAHDNPRSLAYYTLAADTAAALYANREAADHYRRAIAIAQRLLETEVDINSKLRHLYTRCGRILEQLGRYDEALEIYGTLQALGQQLDDPALELAALIPQATIYATPTSRLDPERADTLSRRALALAEELGDHAAEARCYWNMMLANQQHSQYAGHSLDSGIKALAIARTHRLREEQAYILLDLGRSFQSTGRLAEAEQMLGEAVGLWRELDNRPLLADSLSTSAQGALMAGRPQEGIRLAEEALQISQSIGNRWGQSFASYNVALLYEEVGRFSEAIDAHYDAERLGREVGFTGTGQFVPLMLTAIYGTLGAPDYQHEHLIHLLDGMEVNAITRLLRLLIEALRELFHGRPEQAYAISSRLYEQAQPFIEPGMGGPMMSNLFARIALEAGQPAAALAAVEWLIEQAQTTGNALHLQDLLHSKGLGLRALGQAEEGKATLQAAAAEAHRQTSRRTLWYILATLYEIAVEDGDTAEATRLAQEGREVVNYLAEQLTADPELREAFLNLPAIRPFR